MHKDVDGVIATGLAHRLNAANLVPFAAEMSPAVLEPRWREAGIDPGYLTWSREARRSMFAPDTDTIALATEDAIKDFISLTQQLTLAPTIGAAAVGPYARTLAGTERITTNVLFVLGSLDPLICGGTGTDCTSRETILAQERRFLPAARSLDAYVLPGAAHGLNIARNAADWFEKAVSWSDDVVGR